MPVLIAVLIVVVALMLIVFPVQCAAAAMGAKRTSFGWCLLALIAASCLHGIGLQVPVLGSVAAFLLAALGFALILDTGYLKGIGIAVLHGIFSILIVVILTLVLGVSMGVLFGA